MTVEIIDVEQGSDEWIAARVGIPTASKFSHILAQSKDMKMRTRYLRDLAGEILTGKPAENFKNAAMERGNAMEAEIVQQYQRANFVEPIKIGFVKNRGLIRGCVVCASPDRFVGKNGILEIKSTMPALLIELLEDERAPELGKHLAQCQGNIWVAERDWVDLQIGYESMPPYKKRVKRDDEYIDKTLKPAVAAFYKDLNALVDRLCSMGAKRMITP
jgi:hypothetical protein